MNRLITQVYFSSMLLISSYSYAGTLPSSVDEATIGIELEHAHSNNIRKTYADKKSGYEQRADLTLGYISQTATNYSVLDYTIDYSHYSEADLENDSNLSGSLKINQHFWSENFQLDLSHFRHSYLIDETGVDLPNNSGDRDVFTVSPLWRLPYSDRAGFDTRYTYTTVRLSDDDKQDTNRNGLSIAWYHALNSKTTYRLSTQYSEVDFLAYDLTYEQLNVDMSLNGRLLNGNYLAKAGYSRLALLDRYEQGGIFQFTYEYRFTKNSLSLSAQRELTDSSLGLGEENPDNSDINFNGTQLQWIDRISLDHSFFAYKGRFTNTNSMYYQRETPLATRAVEPRGGISTIIIWKHTRLLKTRIYAQYSQIQLEENIHKKEWQANISSEYRFHPKLVFSLGAQFTEQIKNELVSGYDEARLIASIRFSH